MKPYKENAVSILCYYTEIEMANRSKEKNRIYQHEWYLRNRKLQIRRNQENKDRKWEWYRNYKKTLACKVCGENHPATLDFHHRDRDAKIDQVCTG